MDQSNPGIRQFCQLLLSDAPAGVYVQPGTQNQRSVIKHVALCNVTGASHGVVFCVTKAGVFPDPANAILYICPIAANDTKFLDWGNGGLAVEPGGSIAAWADAPDVICLTVSGIEYF